MVRKRLGGLGLRIFFEPGRILVGNAGILVSEVVYIKKGAAKTFVILDAAMNDLIRPTLYDAHHDILPVKSEEIRREVAARWYAFRDADKAPNATGSDMAAADMTASDTVASPRSAGNRKKIKFLVRWGKKT